MGIKCVNCVYWVENDNGYEYCTYFCEPLTRVFNLELCKWVDNEDNNQHKDERIAD